MRLLSNEVPGYRKAYFLRTYYSAHHIILIIAAEPSYSSRNVINGRTKPPERATFNSKRYIGKQNGFLGV